MDLVHGGARYFAHGVKNIACKDRRGRDFVYDMSFGVMMYRNLESSAG